jgi:hypothetical protein
LKFEITFCEKIAKHSLLSLENVSVLCLIDRLEANEASEQLKEEFLLFTSSPID